MQLNWLTFKVTVRNCRIGVKIQTDSRNAEQSNEQCGMKLQNTYLYIRSSASKSLATELRG